MSAPHLTAAPGIALSDLTASLAGLAILTLLFGAVMLLFMLPRARALAQRLEQAGARRWTPQTIDIGERSVSVRISPQPRQGAPQLLFSTPLARQPTLQIRRLTWLDRLARAGGIARTASSGDPAFDRRLLVSCDYRELASVMLREAATREAVLNLFAAGACALEFGDGQLTAHFVAAGPIGALQDSLQARAELLAALARLQVGFVGALTPMTPFWPGRRLLLLCGAVLIPLAAILACAALLERCPPLDLQAFVLDTLQPAALCWLGLLIPALICLRGHPGSAQLLPIAVLAASVAAVPSATAVNLLRNGRDAAAARDVVVAVTGSIKLSGSHAATLRWSSAGLQRRGLFGTPHVLSAEVGADQWQTTPIARAQLHARIAPGALGHPWLLSVGAVSAPAEAVKVGDPSPPASHGSKWHGPQPALAVQLNLLPGSGSELLARAKGLYTDGDAAAARACLDQALLQLEHEGAATALRADGYWYRATVYGSLGTPFEARQEADARSALALVPGHSGAALLLDDVLVRHRRYDEALQLWESVLAEQPDYQYGHYKHAQLLAALGALADARNEAQASCSHGERFACDLLESF